MNAFIWSDLHLGHKNIIKYESRPFDSVKQMNKKMLSNWRKTIGKYDTIICLGDVCFGMSKEQIQKILNNLLGKKILVMGNHDRHRSVKWWREAGFDEVYPYPIILEEFYILSHEPVYINDSMPYVNIHGHCHKEKTNNFQKVNVCVENTDYMPVSFEKIKEIWK